MAKESAWRADLRGPIADLFRLKDGVLPAWMSARNSAETIADIVLTLLEPHIKAAEQRGYSAGVSKNGATVRELRQQLAKGD